MAARAYALPPAVHGYKSIWDAANDGKFFSQSVAKLSWLIVGLACTGSNSAPAEPNRHARETTELHMLNIYIHLSGR